MNNQSEYIRINVTVRKSSLERYRKMVVKSQQNVSKLVDDALVKEIAQAKRLQALRKLKQLGPAFPEVANASAYIQKMREEDGPRVKRLGM